MPVDKVDWNPGSIPSLACRNLLDQPTVYGSYVEEMHAYDEDIFMVEKCCV